MGFLATLGIAFVRPMAFLVQDPAIAERGSAAQQHITRRQAA